MSDAYKSIPLSTPHCLCQWQQFDRGTPRRQGKQRRAAAAGQSLQEYLLGRLRIEAETPTIDELFSRIEQRSGGNVGLKTAAQLVRAEREAK